MDVLSWILTILLFIVSLGVLILIHELGHFSMAKLFNVYCSEFSIGFGPALLHKRRKGKETYFSIRAFPLGGYVAMAGEDTDENEINVPKERTIEGIKRWKKAIILAAGITLNAVLALTLFAISNIAFPMTYLTTKVEITETSPLYAAGVRENDQMGFLGPTGSKQIIVEDEYNGQTYQGSFYIIDQNATITEKVGEDFVDKAFVMCFVPNGNKNKPVLSQSVFFYPVDQDGKMKEFKTFKQWAEQGYELTNYPDVTKGTYNPISSVTVKCSPKFFTYKEDGSYEEEPIARPFEFKSVETQEGSGKFAWQDLGVEFKLHDEYLPFGDRVVNTFKDFGDASVMVAKGIVSLFTGGIKNMSGIVGILQLSSTVLNNYAFSRYLWLWGVISVNLAIFNLLPFPGLDGWQLLVTAVEGGTNAAKKKIYRNKNNGDLTGYEPWKIPTKVKSIISFIGLALLFLLMIAIVVLDVLRWVGI